MDCPVGEKNYRIKHNKLTYSPFKGVVPSHIDLELHVPWRLNVLGCRWAGSFLLIGRPSSWCACDVTSPALPRARPQTHSHLFSEYLCCLLFLFTRLIPAWTLMWRGYPGGWGGPCAISSACVLQGILRTPEAGKQRASRQQISGLCRPGKAAVRSILSVAAAT